MTWSSTLRTCRGVTVVRRRSGVFIHRTLHCGVRRQCSGLAVNVVASVVDSMGVRECVRQRMCHVHLL